MIIFYIQQYHSTIVNKKSWFDGSYHSQNKIHQKVNHFLILIASYQLDFYVKLILNLTFEMFKCF
jgi:hypothetical protein